MMIVILYCHFFLCLQTVWIRAQSVIQKTVFWLWWCQRWKREFLFPLHELCRDVKSMCGFTTIPHQCFKGDLLGHCLWWGCLFRKRSQMFLCLSYFSLHFNNSFHPLVFILDPCLGDGHNPICLCIAPPSHNFSSLGTLCPEITILIFVCIHYRWNLSL